MAKAAKIKEIYRDDDGWWLAYNPGWQSSNDPGCHGEHEDTKREVLALAKNALPCDCEDCKAALSKKADGVTA